MFGLSLFLCAALLVPSEAEAQDRPPVIPDFGNHILVSSVQTAGGAVSTGGLAGGVEQLNLFYTEGTYKEICVVVASGVNGSSYDFKVKHIDAAGLPSTDVWTGTLAAIGANGMACLAFSAGTVADSAEFLGSELEVNAGDEFWLSVERSVATGSPTFWHVGTGSYIELRKPASGVPTPAVRGMVEDTSVSPSVLKPETSSVVAIFLVDDPI
jgi:hypothetical protein